MEDLTSLAVALKVERVKKGITQSELAKKSGVALCTISFIEKGVGHPRPLTLAKLAKALEIDEKTFLQYVM